MVNLFDKSFRKWIDLQKYCHQFQSLVHWFRKSQLYQLAKANSGNTDWGIQVGAYSKAKVAKLMIQLVHDHLNLERTGTSSKIEKEKDRTG